MMFDSVKLEVNIKKALIIYLFFFLLLFVQFPIAGSLVGKVDIWFYVAAFNNIGNYIHSFLFGNCIGSSMYTSANTIYWGNYSFGQALFFLPFKYLGFSDIVSAYFLIAIIFTLNAWGVFLINMQLGLQPFFALIGGFFFSCCNFSFGNFDNPDALFFGTCFLSLYYFLKYLRNFKWRNIIAASVLCALGAYFSSYNFLFNLILLCLFLLFYKKREWSISRVGIQVFITSLLGVILIFPYLYTYVFSNYLLNAYNPIRDLKSIHFVSLNFNDLFRVIPGNIIYRTLNDMDINWLYKTRSLFTGYTLLCLAIAGFKIHSENKRLLSVVFFVFLILSIGPYWVYNERYFAAPMFYLYKWAHIQSYFRINVRAYFICVMIISFFSAVSLQRIFLQTKKHGVIALILIFFTLENVPSSFQKYSSEKIIGDAGDVLYGTSCNLKNILNLPSNISALYHPDFKTECNESQTGDVEFGITREHIYMCLQTKNHQNTINGVTGFLSKERIENQILIQDINYSNNLEKLIRQNRLTHILYHKKYDNGCSYSTMLLMLKKSNLLRLERETEKVIQFEVISGPE